MWISADKTEILQNNRRLPFLRSCQFHQNPQKFLCRLKGSWGFYRSFFRLRRTWFGAACDDYKKNSASNEWLPQYIVCGWKVIRTERRTATTIICKSRESCRICRRTSANDEFYEKSAKLYSKSDEPYDNSAVTAKKSAVNPADKIRN